MSTSTVDGVVVQVNEEGFFEEPEAWRLLRDFYGTINDRVHQVRAGERYLRLGGDPKR